METLNNIVKYEYYDTPEGSDVFKKFVYTAKYVAPATMVAASYDVMLYSHPKGYSPIIARYLAYMGPALGMTAAFTAGTFISTNLRQKDDYWNCVSGGVASGSVYGAARSSVLAGFKCSLVMIGLLMLRRHAHVEGYEILPEPQLQTQGGPSYVKKMDWTISKEIPGNWTRNPEEAK